MLHGSHFSICSASVLGIEEISILARYLALFQNQCDRFENRTISSSSTWTFFCLALRHRSTQPITMNNNASLIPIASSTNDPKVMPSTAANSDIDTSSRKNIQTRHGRLTPVSGREDKPISSAAEIMIPHAVVA
jgi:hypothetical protein